MLDSNAKLTNSSIDAQTTHEISETESTNIRDENTPVEGNRSTGPRTAHGKRRSSRNACKHGFFAKETLKAHLPKKDRREYSRRLKRLRESWKPEGESEHIQIELMAHSLYKFKQLLRISTVRKAGLGGFCILDGDTSSQMDAATLARWHQELPSLDDFEKLQRYESHISKSYYRAQDQLERLQKNRLGISFKRSNDVGCTVN
jgi:hypothetical protein